MVWQMECGRGMDGFVDRSFDPAARFRRVSLLVSFLHRDTLPRLWDDAQHELRFAWNDGGKLELPPDGNPGSFTIRGNGGPQPFASGFSKQGRAGYRIKCEMVQWAVCLFRHLLHRFRRDARLGFLCLQFFAVMRLVLINNLPPNICVGHKARHQRAGSTNP